MSSTISQINNNFIASETSTINDEIVVNNPDFKVTLNSLWELKEIDTDFDEEDEDEIYYPSDYAFNGSLELLNKLYNILGSAFPCGFASVESRGGVDLIWKNKVLDKQVWFKFPVAENFKPTVYFRKDEQSKLIKQPQVEFVAKLLQWLLNQDSDSIL